MPVKISSTVVLEIVLAVYCLFGVASSIYFLEIAAVPFQLLFFLGFTSVSVMSLKHALVARQPQRLCGFTRKLSMTPSSAIGQKVGKSPGFARHAKEYLDSGLLQKALEICLQGTAAFPWYGTGALILGQCYDSLWANRSRLCCSDPGALKGRAG